MRRAVPQGGIPADWLFDYNNAIQALYGYASDGLDDVMVMRRRGNVAPAPANPVSWEWPSTDYYFVADDMGSVVAAVGRDGEVIERYEYDDFGVPTILAPDGVTPRAVSTIDNPVLYTGARGERQT